ncbi:acetyl-CoA carboxylase biotin carboxyl carrier protein subunit [Clostridium tyrobutyricum]
MPGSVWKILVQVGNKVKKGDSIIIEESMKMEFPQNAPCDGTVQEIYVKETENVSSGQILVTIN